MPPLPFVLAFPQAATPCILLAIPCATVPGPFAAPALEKVQAHFVFRMPRRKPWLSVDSEKFFPFIIDLKCALNYRSSFHKRTAAKRPHREGPKSEAEDGRTRMKLTRRSFLKLAGVGAGTAALGGLWGCGSSEGTAPAAQDDATAASDAAWRDGSRSRHPHPSASGDQHHAFPCRDSVKTQVGIFPMRKCMVSAEANEESDVTLTGRRRPCCARRRAYGAERCAIAWVPSDASGIAGTAGASTAERSG